MLLNYLKTAFRNLRKNKGFTAINILGLALGLATCLLIVFYVFDELGYDRFNLNADRIVRVNEDSRFAGNTDSWAITPAPLAAAVRMDFPEIVQTVRFRSNGGFQVKKGNQDIREEKMIYVDSTLFNVFTLPMIDGNPATALVEPHSVVITENTAKKYFDKTNVVGQVLIFDDSVPYKVTGVIGDIPHQSHFNFDFFISMSTLAESRETVWLSNNFNTYLLLKPGADYKKLEARLPEFLKRQVGPQLASVLHLDFKTFEQGGNYLRYNLTPLKEIHLESNRRFELGVNGSLQYVYIFAAIALFILLLACINFMNLSTARSSNRAVEVGVRKVLGSPRKNLVAQFLTESMMVTLAGAILAFLTAWALLPFFNQLSGKELTLTAHLFFRILPVTILLVLVIGCLAGAYPAFFLSAFQPIDVLKGKLTRGFKGGFLRSFLVVFQFAISIFLIIGTLVIYNQLKYIQNKDLGFNRDHVLVVNNTASLGGKAKVFKQSVKQLAGVGSVSLADALPTSNYGNSNIFSKDPVIDQKRALLSQIWGVDEDYIPTLGIKILSGRNFSNEMKTDQSGVILNETAAKILGFKDPVNQQLYSPTDASGTATNTYHIIGVMKDFNFQSLRDNVTPMIFTYGQNAGAFSVRIHSADIPVLLEQVKSKWAEISTQPFSYSFLDQDFDALYRSEQRIGAIFVSFTTLAIIIACLGLFGLASYAAEQRTREIGIRKVLGADMSSIVGMLSKDFIKLVVIAIVVSSPLAWLVMQKWLQGFAYRREIQWWVLALAAFASLMIALITISFQSIRAALANPVESLKRD